MRVLLDENLSPSLVRHLEPVYVAVHVRDVGLRGHADREVWAWARENVSAIVSKDTDFVDLVVVEGPPPKIILLQLGNCRTAQVSELLQRRAKDVARFLASDTEALLLLG